MNLENKKATRQSYGEALKELGEKNKDVVVLDADLAGATKSGIFKKEFSSIEEASSVIAEFIPKNENNYTIKCKIVENNETIFEVKTFAGSRERAKRIVDNWNKHAKTIYPKMLNLLLKDE